MKINQRSSTNQINIKTLNYSINNFDKKYEFIGNQSSVFDESTMTLYMGEYQNPDPEIRKALITAVCVKTGEIKGKIF